MKLYVGQFMEGILTYTQSMEVSYLARCKSLKYKAAMKLKVVTH